MDDPMNAGSPLQNLTAEKYQGKTYAIERAVSIDTTRVEVLSNNPNRVAFQIINTSAIEIRISQNATLTSSIGFQLSPSGGVISMGYDEDGDSVGYTLFGVALAAGGSVWVREVIRS